ncbi:uncharacterized protein LOC115772908 [Archocentrus centrarchus]|uniref:uncharacterized protein LOC115772908 n=1 Tax=Archocentrus centrarchus TaxID=63155 RepID=UPI0011E9C48A|nr:uncharacterized protein LOC115772908 [Archocentrus centrarchus]
MAQRVQSERDPRGGSDDKDPVNIFRRLGPPIVDEPKPEADVHQPRKISKPFINFKIEVVNDSTNKRKQHDSSPDATPLKKPFGAKALSPDLGCCVDCCSPLARQDSASSFATSNPALMHKTQDVGSEETGSFQLLSENPKPRSSVDPGGKTETRAGDLMCEKVLLNPSPAFDYDVDDLLSLNLGSPARSLVDQKSCVSPSSQNVRDEQFPNLSVEVGTADGRGDEVKKEMCLSVKDGEEDGGYFSLSCINDRKGGGWVNSEQLTANLNPCLRSAEGDCHPQSSSTPQVHNPAVTSGHFTVTVDDLSPSDSGPLLEHVGSKVNCLESCDVEEVWDIGPPIFESSICHSETDNLKAEQSSQVLEEVQESVTKPVHSTPARADSTVETSCESTLPLQVQVKSKVVVSSQHPDRSALLGTPVPVANRPMVFSSEVEWERHKRLYVHSVVSHMYENTGGDNGVTSELQNLMSSVADKSAEWQHPSDLTRRHYRRRFGTAAEITLYEWQAKNGLMHRRFDKLPKKFERSSRP